MVEQSTAIQSSGHMKRVYTDPTNVIGLLKSGTYDAHHWQELNLHAHLLLSAHQIDHLLALDNIPGCPGGS